MERLTARMADGTAYVVSETGKEGVGHFTTQRRLPEVIARLAEYEDLEEQGRLLKLPCKIGDAVYVIPSKANFKLNQLNGHDENNRIYKQMVEKIVTGNTCWYIRTNAYPYRDVLREQSYGETWFLTKEEAVAKLAEMRGADDGGC